MEFSTQCVKYLLVYQQNVKMLSHMNKWENKELQTF